MNKTYVIFAIHYLPHLGGVERYVYNLAKKLIRDGNRVFVVASNIEELPTLEKMERVKVVRMPALNFMGGRFPVLLPNRRFWELNRKLVELKPDLIIVNSRFYFHSLYALLFARVQHIPAFEIDHGTSHMLTGNAIADKIGEIFEHGITLLERGLCGNYYGVSKDVTNWLKHFHIQAKGVLYNSIDMEYIEQLLETEPRRQRETCGIALEAPVITYTGRLVREKGSLELIRAVEMLNEKREKAGELPIHLMIAGDGEIMEEVRSHESEYVHPLGRLPFEQIVALLGESDIFCLPTAYPEGFPTSTLEAVACGCYPIVTPNGGARELITDDSLGCVIPDNAPETIAEAIEKALLDSEARICAAEKCRLRVRERFTWDYTASQVEQILEELQ